MATATQSRRACRGLPVSPASATTLPPAPAPAVAQALGRARLEGALERIGLARRCLQRGNEPAHHLRMATLQIREATACLAAGAEAGIAANLGELTDYMCRQLVAADGAAGLTALTNVCDLLGELRCAYLTLPAAAWAADGLAGAAARL